MISHQKKGEKRIASLGRVLPYSLLSQFTIDSTTVILVALPAYTHTHTCIYIAAVLWRQNVLAETEQ